MKAQPDTKVVFVHLSPGFSSAQSRLMKITLPRLPWEPKEEFKEDAA